MKRIALPDRRSLRLPDYDYAQNGAYFVTICAAHRLCIFGDVSDGEIDLSPVGNAVDNAWRDLPKHTPGLVLDAWVVMPNHLHGVIILPGCASTEVQFTSSRRLTPGSLGAVIGGFKSAVSRLVAARNLAPVRPIWQRNYFERVLRNDRELAAVRGYIAANPARWSEDPEYPFPRPLPS